MAEYAAASHPHPASPSSEMLASLFPADCSDLLVYLPQLEALAQQVADRIS